MIPAALVTVVSVAAGASAWGGTSATPRRLDHRTTAARTSATPAISPTPAASPTSPPPPSPVAQLPAFHAAAPTVWRSRLITADGLVNTGVGVYSDCSGATPLTRTEAAIDTCVGGRTYFVGHTPGVFSGLAGEAVGSIINWWDGAGNDHRLRVIDRRYWARDANGGMAPVISSSEIAEFQTCVTGTTAYELILDTVAA